MRHNIQLQIPRNVSKEYLIDLLALLPDGAVIQSIDWRFANDCAIAVIAHPDFKAVPDYLEAPMAQLEVQELKLPFCEVTHHPSRLIFETVVKP